MAQRNALSQYADLPTSWISAEKAHWPKCNYRIGLSLEIGAQIQKHTTTTLEPTYGEVGQRIAGDSVCVVMEGSGNFVSAFIFCNFL